MEKQKEIHQPSDITGKVEMPVKVYTVEDLKEGVQLKDSQGNILEISFIDSEGIVRYDGLPCNYSYVSEVLKGLNSGHWSIIEKPSNVLRAFEVSIDKLSQEEKYKALEILMKNIGLVEYRREMF